MRARATFLRRKEYWPLCRPLRDSNSASAYPALTRWANGCRRSAALLSIIICDHPPLAMATRHSAALLAVHELLYPFVGTLYVAANREGGPEDVSGGNWTDELLMSNGGQAHGGDTT